MQTVLDEQNVREVMMKKRFVVYDGEHAFAFVHAESAEQAIRLACEKTNGHERHQCTARLEEIRPDHPCPDVDG
jgi:hypothetical protein